MDRNELLTIIRDEIPRMIDDDEAIRRSVLDLYRRHFVERDYLDERLDRYCAEGEREREESRKFRERLDAQRLEDQKKWDEQKRRSAENDAMWHEEMQRIAENDLKWREDAKRWKENDAKCHAEMQRIAENDEQWREDAERWRQNDERWHEESMALTRKIDSFITGIGARWGLRTERSFRNGLTAVLEEMTECAVEQYVELDLDGEVFGRPDQVEIDVVARNGSLVLMEIKSSMSRSDMYAFDRKVRFYERRHGRTADRRIVVSPMIDSRAREVAESLGIECFSHSLDIGEV